MSSEVKAVGALGLLYAFRMLGLFMVLPILVLYGASYEGASPFLLGLALGIYGLTQALLQIPMGLVSDLIGRKPVIVFGLILFALGSVIAALADSVTWLIVGRALQGSGAIASTIMAMVSDLTSEQNRTKAMAAIGASIGVSFAIAMVLGPLVSGFGGLEAVFHLSAMLSLLGVAIVLFIIPTPQTLTSRRDSAAVPALLKSTLKNKALFRLNVGIFMLHAMLMASFLALPQVIEDSFGLSRASHWQVYLPMLAVAMIVILPLIIVAEKKRKIKPVFLGAIVCLLVSQGLLGAISLQSQVFWALMLLFFVAFNLLEACLPSLISKLAPAGSKGTAMGVYSTSQFLGAFAGGAGGGAVLSAWGMSGLFYAGALCAAMWLLVAFSMRPPKYLTSLSELLPQTMPSSADDIQATALLTDGVEEAFWDGDESVLYLKVDKSLFNREVLLRRFGLNA